jgi:hypothetical protein
MLSDEHLLRIDDTGSLRAEMGRGLVASLALHAGLLLVILLGLWWTVSEPLEPPRALTVKLVRFAAETRIPAAARGTPTGNETAEPKVTPAKPADTPVGRKAPLAAAAKEAAAIPLPEIAFRMEMGRFIAPASLPRFEPRPKPSATESLAARLHLLAHLRTPAMRHQSDDPGFGGTGPPESMADGAGHDSTNAVKDFIRAQVERRWNPDRREIGAQEWVVRIHMELGRDGKVLRADVVGAGRHNSDSYLDFARSARNAVLVSSPLALPPGMNEIARDIVVDFDLRDATR